MAQPTRKRWDCSRAATSDSCVVCSARARAREVCRRLVRPSVACHEPGAARCAAGFGVTHGRDMPPCVFRLHIVEAKQPDRATICSGLWRGVAHVLQPTVTLPRGV